jgi:hypothetical protein
MRLTCDHPDISSACNAVPKDLSDGRPEGQGTADHGTTSQSLLSSNGVVPLDTAFFKTKRLEILPICRNNIAELRSLQAVIYPTVYNDMFYNNALLLGDFGRIGKAAKCICLLVFYL